MINRRSLFCAVPLLPFISIGVLASTADQGLDGKRTIYDAANEILEELSPLPIGYRVNVDYRTDCIFIHNEEFGFAITRRVIKDGNHVKNAKAEFENLLSRDPMTYLGRSRAFRRL
jgi:hypothetical protein